VSERAPAGQPAVAALPLVEYLTGRSDDPPGDLPTALAAQFERARQIL
jgi:hypothetical protein